MNAQDVIARGSDIDIPNQFMHTSFSLMFLAVFTWFIILVVATRIRIAIDEGRSESRLSIGVGILGLVAGCASTAAIIVWHLGVSSTYSTETAEWKTEMVYPYIKSQMYVDLELTSIEKDPYAGADQPNEIIKYRNAEQIIEQLDSPERTRYDNTDGEKSYQLIYDVPAGEKPFVRFYTLDEDLGHGMEPGPYGLEIHLNEKK